MASPHQVDVCTAILRGEREPDPRFSALIRVFSDEFGIEVVDVVHDADPTARGTARLGLWCRSAADVEAFRGPDGNYNAQMQARAAELVPGGPWWVYVVDHSHEALCRFVAAGCRNVGTSAAVLLNDQRVVHVDGVYGRLVVFVRTKAEAAALRQLNRKDPRPETATGSAPDDLVSIWERILWEAFAEFHSPDAVPRDCFVLEVDSQEAYDVDFHGNGYYYWR